MTNNLIISDTSALFADTRTHPVLCRVDYLVWNTQTETPAPHWHISHSRPWVVSRTGCLDIALLRSVSLGLAKISFVKLCVSQFTSHCFNVPQFAAVDFEPAWFSAHLVKIKGVFLTFSNPQTPTTLTSLLHQSFWRGQTGDVRGKQLVLVGAM